MPRLKAENPHERGCYLGGGSRLGKRCHWFLSAATSSTDTAEATAMTLQPRGSPTLLGTTAASHTLQYLCSAQQTSCPPPATVRVKTKQWAQPSTGECLHQNQSKHRAGLQCGDWPIGPRARGGVVPASSASRVRPGDTWLRLQPP